MVLKLKQKKKEPLHAHSIHSQNIHFTMIDTDSIPQLFGTFIVQFYIQLEILIIKVYTESGKFFLFL